METSTTINDKNFKVFVNTILNVTETWLSLSQLQLLGEIRQYHYYKFRENVVIKQIRIFNFVFSTSEVSNFSNFASLRFGKRENGLLLFTNVYIRNRLIYR